MIGVDTVVRKRDANVFESCLGNLGVHLFGEQWQRDGPPRQWHAQSLHRKPLTVLPERTRGYHLAKLLTQAVNHWDLVIAIIGDPSLTLASWNPLG